MHVLIICEDSQQAELLTVAARQVGLRGVVRPSLPSDSSQLSEVALVILDIAREEHAHPALRSLRSLVDAPIVVLCPPCSDRLQLELFHSGATSIFLKPGDLRLIVAHALALTRLTAAVTAPASHPLLDPDTQTLTLPHGDIRLTTLEYRLLAALLSRPGRVMSPQVLVEHVWGYSGDGDRSLVKGLVNRVRRKIEPAPHEPRYLQTEPGVGYRFMLPATDERKLAMDHGAALAGVAMGSGAISGEWG